MRETFKVLWTTVAEKDLLGIVEYFAHDNPHAARKALGRIRSVTAKLDRSPERGRIVPVLLEHGISRYREVVVRPWRVIYRVEERKVYVVAVIDGRRNVEDVLLERLLR